MFVERKYRQQFNIQRFTSFEIKYCETDLWIGIDPASFRTEMQEMVLGRIKELRQKMDDYILTEPLFKKTMNPFLPCENSPIEAKEMAAAAEKAGIGPMSAVAGLFAREAGEAILRNFLVEEMVIENGGDIFVLLKKELVLSVFAGNSPLSERIGLAIPEGLGKFGICTSAGTVGHSFSDGKADAVMVICSDVLLADAFATAFGNKVKTPDDVEKVINMAEKIPEILSLLIICEDKIGVRGNFELRLLK
ncbi:MAG: UPF0280 family protein [Bacteroidales bacterium]|jgi:ApbE superfamily uncharacterized protein (UPF0280 family)|nr:UPF0280 family protein [Bacteroidales bacterium]